MTIESLLSALEAMSHDAGLSQEFVGFQRHILEAQHEAFELAVQAYPEVLVPTGAPLAGSQVLVAPAAIQRMLVALETVPQSSAAQGAEVGRMVAALRSQPDIPALLVRSCVGRVDMLALKRLAASLEVSPFAALLVGRLLARPFVAAAVSRLMPHFAPPELSHEIPGRCPRCDSPAALSTLSPPDGHRFLVCGTCDLSWPYPRIKCPTCGNTDPASLAVLQLGDDLTRRLEVCDTCRRYLVLVDQRKLPPEYPVHPLLEAVTGLHLDIAAEEQKYVREAL